MQSNRHMSLEQWPDNWDELLSQLNVDQQADRHAFWKSLVAKYVTATDFDNEAEADYQEIFHKFWTEDRPNIVNNPEGVLYAAACGDEAYIQHYLAQLPAEQRQSLVNHHAAADNNTALHVAVKYGDWRTVKVLIDNGADINAKGFFNQTPLHLAIYHDYPDLIEDLLKAGALTNIKSSDSEMPIHLACRLGNVGAVNLLLQHDISQLKQVSKEGRTPFYAAAMAGKIEVMNVLLSQQDDVNQFNPYARHTVLHLAAIKNNPQLIEFLARQGADVNKVDGAQLTPLQRAAMQDKPCLEAAEALIKAGAEVNAGNPSPFYLLTSIANIEASPKAEAFAKLLLENGAKLDVRAHGKTVFDYLVGESNESTVQYNQQG